MNPFQNLWGKVTVGEGTKIGAFCDIGDDVEIGENCRIQCFVSIPPGTRIGNNVFIGPHVGIANHKDIRERDDWKRSPVIIEDSASIGMGAMLGPGIRIGHNAIVGMGAVVIKDVDAHTTMVGNPAHPIS